MADFISDGGQGTVDPVYVKVKGMSLLQIFPTQYNRKDFCQLLGSPSEGGLKQFDNKVRMPSTVQFTGILKVANKNVLEVIRKTVREHKLDDILCEFLSKGGKLEKMIIESCEEVGDPNRYDAMEIRMQLQEYLEHNIS